MLRAESSTLRSVRDAGPTAAWLDHALLAAALGVLLAGFSTVIGGADWWFTTFLVCALVGLTCAVLRAVGFRWVAPVAILVELLALTWIFVPSTLYGGLVPTWSSVTGLTSLLDRAQTIIIEELPPVAQAKSVVLVLAGSFGLIVVFADVLLRRRRAAVLVGVLLLAVYATPPLISGDTPPFLLFAVPAALWLVLLRSRTREASRTGWPVRIPAMLVAAAALFTSLVLPPLLPDVTAVASGWGKGAPEVFGRGINPMLQLGQNLRRNSTRVAAQYTTNLPQAPYLKVATLRDFTGKTWRPIQNTTDDDNFEGRIGLADGIKTSDKKTTIRIRDLRSSMLPVPYPTQDVAGLKGEWHQQRAGLTWRSPNDDTRGQRYTATSTLIEPTAAQMRQVTNFIGARLAPYVELPAEVPEIITRTARAVTDGATNEFDRVMALQTYLRGGQFTYSETAPVAEDYDGNGLDVLAVFLQKRSGYCVHFSSAMAVMARSLGIPARIAVGYAPGRVVSLTRGQNLYAVTNDDLHAWTEIYFSGIGWTRFDPTPGVGSAASFEEPGSASQAPLPPSQANGGDPQARGDDRVDAVPNASQDQTAPRSAIVVAAGILLVILAPGAVRLLLRRYRLRSRSPDQWWRELEASATDLGVETSLADTPRGFAGRLSARPGVDTDALHRLLDTIETTRFARPGSESGRTGSTDAQAVLRSLTDGASRRARLRAALLPRSLARATRPAPHVEPLGI